MAQRTKFYSCCQHLPSCYPYEYNQSSCILFSILPNTSHTFPPISRLPSSLPTIHIWLTPHVQELSICLEDGFAEGIQFPPMSHW